MSIARISTAQSKVISAQTLTFAIDCTGATKLVVTVYLSSGALTGVTYNGVAMTVADNGIATNTMWYLDSPTTGSNNVVITGTTTGLDIFGTAASYSGTITGVDNHTNGTSSASSIGIALTPNFNNCWVIMGAGNNNNSAITANNGSTTLLLSQNNAAGSNSLSDTNGPITPQAATTLNVLSAGGAATWKGAIISIAPLDTSARFWVGGTGTWDTTTTTHWSLTSGGAGGASPPSSTTVTATFDGNSGGGTVTTGASLALIDLTFVGFTGTLAGSNTLNISGNLALGSGMTITYTGAITFSSTASGKTITSNGRTLLSAVTFNGVGGGWSLQDAFITTGTSVTLTNGSLNMNNFGLTTPLFSSSNSNVRVFTMGSGTLTITGAGTGWSISTTNLTFNYNTGTIKLSDASASTKTFNGLSLTYYNFYITGAGSGAYTITGSNTFNDFKIDTPPHTVNFTAGTTQTLVTFTCSGTAGNLMTLQSTTSGSPWYMHKSTVGTIVCDYLSLQDSHVS